MLGYILYELAELTFYSGKVIYNGLYSLYNWNSQENNNLELSKELIKQELKELIKQELKDEIKQEILELELEKNKNYKI
jgi:hypothetical protein